jgi:hypothetical protein
MKSCVMAPDRDLCLESGLVIATILATLPRAIELKAPLVDRSPFFFGPPDEYLLIRLEIAS